jgi:D-alanyl-D-alanine carboxypeptidase (penicillin-binding protein 5/6)
VGRSRAWRVRWKSHLLFLTVLSLLWWQTGAVVAADSPPDIAAAHAVVVSADTGEVLFDKGMDAETAPASLTKIFTAAVALETAPLDQPITIAEDDLVGESAMGLVAGQDVTLRTLLYGMMLPSGNDAAMAIARGLSELSDGSSGESIAPFMERVNELAQRLGLTHTRLVNPHGLDEPGHVSSARDVAAITMYALGNPEFRRIIGSPYYVDEGFELYNSNELLTSYTGLIGGKTGITDEAGYCLVEVAQRDGHTIIAVVLGSTIDDWYTDAISLLDYGFATLAAAPSDPDRPRITLAPATPAVVTPTVQTPSTEGSALTVDRVADTTAVVHAADAEPGGGGLSWRWPLASVATMGLALALIVNYPVLLGVGGLLWQRRRAGSLALGAPALLGRLFRPRPQRRRARPTQATQAITRTAPVRRAAQATPTTRTAAPVWRPSTARIPAEPQVVPLNRAEALASRAVRLARRGDYRAATHEFARALQADPTYDLTRCPGFWSMDALGYVAAARAYLLLNRPADARTLATIVQLSYGSSRELERVLARTSPAAALV